MLNIGKNIWFLLGAVLFIVVLDTFTVTSWFRRRRAAQENYFKSQYGSSMDRMMAECKVDKDKLRKIRDRDSSGPMKAAYELQRTEPVSLKVATDFVHRL